MDSSQYSIHCIEIPEEIKAEIIQCYPLWSQDILFTESIMIQRPAYLSVIPAKLFLSLSRQNLPRKTLIFGPSSLLEPSFLAGADDYIKEPYNCSELIIRIRRLCSDMELTIGSHILELKNCTLIIDSKIIKLNRVSQRLMELLLRNYNLYMDFQLIREYCGMRNMSKESLYVHIHTLRSILKEYLPEAYGKKVRIENASNKGYALIIHCG